MSEQLAIMKLHRETGRLASKNKVEIICLHAEQKVAK
jgi:hypothetical protein